MPDLYVSETWRGRWVVATKPWVESDNDATILASFGDRRHAEAWQAEHINWLKKLRHTTL